MLVILSILVEITLVSTLIAFTASCLAVKSDVEKHNNMVRDHTVTPETAEITLR